MRRILLCIAVLAIAGLLAPPAYTQVLYGSLVGAVEDQSGSVVPKANITITNKGTGATRETASDEQGRFSLLNLLPGAYDLKVAAPGFRTVNRTDMEVAINTVTRQEIRLEVATINEQVTVSANAATLQTEKSDVRHELTGSTIENLPLPGYRNYQSLLALVPGATPPALQNAVVDTPGRALRSFVNGTATNNNNTLTDGAVNINIWLPHHVAIVQPSESIETVNISTGSFDAEQGMAGGAAVTVATKSGTNNLHGTGWWFNNNQHLNSDPTISARPTTEAAGHSEHFRRQHRRADQEGQAVLLLQFRAHHRTHRLFRRLLGGAGRFPRRRFQQVDQPVDRLRSGIGAADQQRGPHAVPEQRDSAEPDQSDLPEYL